MLACFDFALLERRMRKKEGRKKFVAAAAVAAEDGCGKQR